jgi:hypothetical protein
MRVFDLAMEALARSGSSRSNDRDVAADEPLRPIRPGSFAAWMAAQEAVIKVQDKAPGLGAGFSPGRDAPRPTG